VAAGRERDATELLCDVLRAARPPAVGDPDRIEWLK
jgi:hypothetical protein